MAEDHPRFKIVFKKRVSILLGIFLMILLTLILIVFKLNPYEQTTLALILFMISFFLAMGSLYSGILLAIKLWRMKEEWPLSSLAISVRQGYILSLGTVLCLALLVLGLLRLWNGVLIVILITLLEAYFSQKD